VPTPDLCPPDAGLPGVSATQESSLFLPLISQDSSVLIEEAPSSHTSSPSSAVRKLPDEAAEEPSSMHQRERREEWSRAHHLPPTTHPHTPTIFNKCIME